ncbi:hypothetical protein OHA79_01335 [Streptomyces sp. NBC_00841]|uniref:hypothetical protein n=1 Tax=Streptomyces sp. NBC_00841 TaxID=2975847 RepID=UPI002DD97923|nr:hypothetical protein [Streptomyces sp. NBC_00841]WRZ96709.1 hypothetical protein OHA79_01335 [Streptomyces sp. NBC_00841]
MLARRDNLIIATAIVAILAITGGGYVYTHNDNGLDNTSAEYGDGYNRAQDLANPSRIGINEAIDRCTSALTAQPQPDVAGVPFFPHYEYSQHQRREWAHGCLDALRLLSTYKVAKQPWE